MVVYESLCQAFRGSSGIDCGGGGMFIGRLHRFFQKTLFFKVPEFVMAKKKFDFFFLNFVLVVLQNLKFAFYVGRCEKIRYLS